MFKNFRAFCVCVLSVFAFSAVAKDVVANFEPTHEPDAVLIHSNVEADSYVLTVKGAQASFKQEFAGEDTPMITLVDPDGNVLPDGLYLYEVTPTFAPSAENSTFDEFDRLAMKADGARRIAHSGSFRIIDGEIVDPSIEEEPVFQSAGKTDEPVNDLDEGRAQVYATDLIVQGSECVGVDCATSESFGSDTIRLKENNLRIHFDDTSASASFPKNDWRIVANDSTNGGAEYLAIQDATANTTPFKIDAGAGNNAIVAESGGFVGFGTSNPAVNLHVKDGNSPALRLEQDGSDGFASQTWDLAGNETNFFIRDVTNGSKLPFRIFPSSSNNDTLNLDAQGEVGISVTNPSSKFEVLNNTNSSYAMHLKSTNATGNANVLIEDTEETTDLDTMIEYKNHGPLQFQMTVTDSANLAAWVFKTGYSDFVIKENASNNKSASFVFGEDGSFDFKGSSTSETPTTLLSMDSSGNVTAAGTVTGSSDVTIKANHGMVDPMSILAKVSELPIARWSYNADECETEHLGPMAQDFHEAFGLGGSDKGIAFVDSDGVALASIQALNSLVEAKDARIEELEAKSAALEARLAAIEKALLNK